MKVIIDENMKKTLNKTECEENLPVLVEKVKDLTKLISFKTSKVWEENFVLFFSDDFNL